MPDEDKVRRFLSTTVDPDPDQEAAQSPVPYESVGSTVVPGVSGPDESPASTDPVVAWQRTRQAAAYRGRWVALDEASGRVIAVEDSPTDFDEDETRGATLVFVRSSGRLAG